MMFQSFGFVDIDYDEWKYMSYGNSVDNSSMHGVSSMLSQPAALRSTLIYYQPALGQLVYSRSVILAQSNGINMITN